MAEQPEAYNDTPLDGGLPDTPLDGGLPDTPLDGGLPDGLARVKGTVRFFNGRRAYGFITPEGGTEENPKDDVFVHKSEIPRGKTLKENDEVEFSIVEEADGRLKAIDVTGGTLEKQNVCYAYREHGYCSYGDRCKFAHEHTAHTAHTAHQYADTGYSGYNNSPSRRNDGYGRRDAYNSDGYQRTQGTCYKFRDTGHCPYGQGCKFLHDNSPRQY